MKLANVWAVAAVVALAPLAPVAVPIAVADNPAAPASGDPKLVFEHYQLANGLDVILAPDKTVPLVAVDVWYHVGAGYEVVGRSGFAHLFEHMMFQGSKHVGEDKHFDTLRNAGASDINGTTNSDRTNYFEVVPSNQIETALWLESDRMGWLLDLLTKPSLANQIDVVRNERRQRVDNVPYGKARLALYEAMFPEGHPYRYTTIGKHEDLANASLDDVKGFFKTWYVPANATLAISGDFEIAQGKELVAKWFAKFPTSAKPKVIPVPAPMVKSTEVTVNDPLAKLTQITFAWQSPASFADGDAELEIIADALDREGPGRLYKALVYDRPLARAVNAGQGGQQFSGVFSITVSLRGEAKLDEVKKIVLDEVARVSREPLAAKEIDRVIAANESATIRGLETAFERAQLLERYNHFLGDPDRLTWDLDRFRKTTPEKIRQAAAAYLSPDHVVTVVTVPAGPAGKGAK